MSAHAYLDPFVSGGHVVSATPHAPYMVIDSVKRWTQSVAANTNFVMQLLFTHTNCRGYILGWTPGAVATGYPIIAPQLGTLTPSHTAPQRLGVSCLNTTNALKRAGNVYTMITNDPLAVAFDADNVADTLIRVTDAGMVALTEKILGSQYTRTVSAQNCSVQPIRHITTMTNPDFIWQDYVYYDPSNDDSNVYFQGAVAAADLMKVTSSVLIYIPGQADAQQYQFTVRSQDGCRFDVDHALFASSRHAPIVPSHLATQLHRSAFVASRAGEQNSAVAPPHESFMQSIGSLVEDVGSVASNVASAVPRIGSAIYNTIRTGRILSSLRSAGAVLGEGAELAPLLLA